MLKEKQASEIFSLVQICFSCYLLFHKTIREGLIERIQIKFIQTELFNIMINSVNWLNCMEQMDLCVTILFFFFSDGVQADADARRGNVRNRHTGDGSEILELRAVHVLVDDKR